MNASVSMHSIVGNISVKTELNVRYYYILTFTHTLYYHLNENSCKDKKFSESKLSVFISYLRYDVEGMYDKRLHQTALNICKWSVHTVVLTKKQQQRLELISSFLSSQSFS